MREIIAIRGIPAAKFAPKAILGLQGQPVRSKRSAPGVNLSIAIWSGWNLSPATCQVAWEPLQRRYQIRVLDPQTIILLATSNPQCPAIICRQILQSLISIAFHTQGQSLRVIHDVCAPHNIVEPRKL